MAYNLMFFLKSLLGNMPGFLATFMVFIALTVSKSEVVLDNKINPSFLQPKIVQFGCDSYKVSFALSESKIDRPPISALNPRAPVCKRKQCNIRVRTDKFGLPTFIRADDSKVLLKQLSLNYNSRTKKAVIRFSGIKKGELLYGFGEHRTNKIAYESYQKNFSDSLFYPKSRGGDVSIPFYMSSSGYGFLFNSPSLGSVNASNSYIEWVSSNTGLVEFWVSTNKAGSKNYIKDILNNYADAVGHPSSLPYFATGFIQSKNRYRNQTELMNVAREYKRRKIPISMIVIDYYHWEQMGDFRLNPHCWPNPQDMVDELATMDIELMITFWPYVGINVSRNWDEYSRKGYLAINITSGLPDSFWGNGNALIDATNADAMNSTFWKWYQGYGKYGVKAIWLDQTEPDSLRYVSGGQWKFAKGIDSEIQPAWVHDWTKGFQKGMENIMRMKNSENEFLLLTRSQFAGTSSHNAAMWSGDISSTWKELQLQVKAGQGAGLSMIPLWTTDIGGYSNGDPNSKSFQQLIVRWFQFGAFSPLFRIHGIRKAHRDYMQSGDTKTCGRATPGNEVWNLVGNNSFYYEAIVRVIRLRESMRSYVQRLSEEAKRTGWPLMRPMWFQFPADPVCTSTRVESQYMFGDAWLVSPVTEENATHWMVYLPAMQGDRKWLYWWNKTTINRTGWINIEVYDIQHFPLFYAQTTIFHEGNIKGRDRLDYYL